MNSKTAEAQILDDSFIEKLKESDMWVALNFVDGRGLTVHTPSEHDLIMTVSILLAEDREIREIINKTADLLIEEKKKEVN